MFNDGHENYHFLENTSISDVKITTTIRITILENIARKYRCSKLEDRFLDQKKNEINTNKKAPQNNEQNLPC